MDDLISRSWLLSEYDKRHKGPPGGARKLIEEAPSALGTDCISRQAAIDVLDAYQVKIEDGEENPYAWARLRMSELPPVQPEIIRCKDCKYGIVDDPEIPTLYFCEHNGQDWNDEYHYCGYSERREVNNESN